jgi:hypothetical protein
MKQCNFGEATRSDLLQRPIPPRPWKTLETFWIADLQR